MDFIDEILTEETKPNDPKSKAISVTCRLSYKERHERIIKELEARKDKKRLLNTQSRAMELIIEKFERELGLAG